MRYLRAMTKLVRRRRDKEIDQGKMTKETALEVDL